ncbi:hypothetical protein [Mycobacterium sp. 1245801.1]|uniref:hypothetical protein n=1 Tax=Mycobacterium sp. 1245801.1 TaxID=1834075 RepID=UPI0007FD1428|nr:hypothetical protein [Mycobacterium sp. 1245801.1]OBJ24622.1 hypothetical protein A5622_11640 [Mycobacterium sp. 1245801.1]
MAKDHLAAALQALAVAQENARIEQLHRPALRLAQTHALIDIAESLRALRPPTPAANTRVFGGKIVHLLDAPLESVGGCDDEDQAS